MAENKVKTVNEPKDEEEQIQDIVLEVKDLHKAYGPKQVLKGVNLEVKKGEVFGFIGKNGIGKSTTIGSIIGLKNFDSGEIYINGHDVKKEARYCKSLFGYVPSEPTAYEMMTGREYLEFVGSSYNMIQESFDSNYKFLVNKLGMDEYDMNKKISEYSHGMKQKVCIMASLIHNPMLWVMDEPTVGLDIIVYEVLTKMIVEFARNGRTVFITSHNLDLVAKVCDRVAIINDGVVMNLIDFRKEPLKRREITKIFFKTYGEEIPE